MKYKLVYRDSSLLDDHNPQSTKGSIISYNRQLKGGSKTTHMDMGQDCSPQRLDD